MASRAFSPQPLDAFLAAIPSLPRPVLAKLTTCLIERLDEIDGDPDLEDDDPAGGNVDDEGEMAEAEDAGGVAIYEIDQRILWDTHGRRMTLNS